MSNARLPDNLHILRGSFRESRHGDRAKATAAATVAVKPPPCPGWMGDEAKREWRRVVRAMAEYNVLTHLDRGILSQYCSLWGQLVTDPASFNAALHGQLRLLQVELGFTPSSRSKLGVMRQDDQEDYDPLA